MNTNTLSPSAFDPRDQPTHPGRRSLSPHDALGPQHVFSSYPSSAMNPYFPSSQNVPNYTHISTVFPPFSPFPPAGGEAGLLPSVSQSHVPSIRRTPSVPQFDNPDLQHSFSSPSSVLQSRTRSRNSLSRTSQRIHSVSPIAFAYPQPVRAAQQPIHIPPLSPFMPLSPLLFQPQLPLPFHPQPPPPLQPQPPPLPPQYIPPLLPPTTNTHFPSFNSSLPSTKDVPLLSGKHDWGPWHSAVRTLVMNANLLGHIADDPLPGASYDPGLWPTYPPAVHQRSTQAEIQMFTDWWTRDGLASHILTSRLTSSVLGCLPIANERMGHRRSSRTVYHILRHQFGAGDYSAVMVIEARLQQLKCLPARGGVRITDFITTWRISVNQMEAAGFLPGTRQLLSIFADGLPHHTVAFINLYDNIIACLNEPNEHLLPNIHLLFDRTINIENNILRNRILNPNPRRSLSTLPPTAPPVQLTSTVPVTSPSALPPAAPSTSRSVRRCSNCGREGHTDDTCFQPGGAMEGRREEYLANRPPRAIAHIAEVEEIQPDSEEGIEEATLTTEFAALTLTTPNDIFFSTYALSSISEVLLEQSFALSSISQEYNSALDSACTNHIFHDRNLFHTYDTSGAVPVKTANCGFLTTLAIGDVKIKLTIGDRTVTWTLTNCLHAPSVPINLISVGALQEHHMSVLFSFQKTRISFPPDHPHLSGLFFDAHVTRRLSLLHLEFTLPPVPPVALQLFPATQLSHDIWHRRFGHLGHEASRNVINGNYVTGIIKPSTPYPINSRCIPCLIGKSPQAPYSNNAKRSISVCDLVHMDTCGPFPTLTPKKEAYFTIFLDDASNYGVTSLLTNKAGVVQAWKRTESSWELTSGNRIKTVRCDGAKEFTQGQLSTHFLSRGITMQITAPYAHAQAGKAERYVRTIEDGIQTLLADAKLPPSFWGDAALTTQYLRNRLPTSTLPPNTTPYEVMHGEKPDLSHLRVWGCQCFPSIPPELRTKAGPRRYEAIFVGYEENRIGWRVRDMAGKYHFSRDVIFNENIPGHLSPHRGLPINQALLPQPSILPHPPNEPLPTSSPPHTTPNPLSSPTIPDILNARNTIIQSTHSTRSTTNSLPKPSKHYNDIDSLSLFISLNTIDDITPPPSPDPSSNHTSLYHDCFLSAPYPFLRNRSWDLTKPPNSYNEAITRPDNAVWHAAMQREVDSLEKRNAFDRTTLPPGRKAIGVRWTYDHKYNPDGSIIQGKEKARLVAQGFSQRPEDFGETYAPVVKLSSVRILLAYANHFNLEIMSFDVKTAFLHARLPYDIYVKQIPGYPELDPSTVLRLLVALYGLKQSSYEWYKLLSSTLAALGLVRCEADHAVFIGRWTAPPHTSIPVHPHGDPLLLIIPVHVDDGLAISNSLPLYNWFVMEISKTIEFICLGPVLNTRYLGQRIIRDRTNRTIQLSQSDLIFALLDDWGLTDCKTTNVPLHHNPSNLPPCSPNTCPDIPDDKILLSYQRLVGSLTYLAICTRPDIAYAAMALGQFNSTPSRAHLACAKGVLRYLSGTATLCLQFPSPATNPSPQSSILPSTRGFSDADWASDEKDRKSISGHCFFFLDSLVSWSSRKQRTVSTSSTESEYYALTNTIKEGIWIKLLLTLTQLPLPTPFPIFCDNQSTCIIAKTDAISSRTKHIDVRHHFIRQHLTDGSFITTWIPTTDMTADILTKPLLSTLFLRHRENLGLILP
jgi:hypothetical protein